MAVEDLIIFLIVLALRLVVPLAIFRFPLPAIIAALVLDAADQTIFQQTTEIDLEKLNYQGYDKALDIYYLAIAYISMFRNWRSLDAINVGTALWYYRLAGVALFELTQTRVLLIIFPNTFEYFFIFMAAVRLRYDSLRFSFRQVAAAAAAIWVFVKLPQEYWIHVAQLDTTDFIKERLFGVDPADGWGTAFGNRPLVLVTILVVFGILGWLITRLLRSAPAPDHALSFDADELPQPPPIASDEPREWHEGIIEKVTLLGLISIIFVQALLGESESAGQVAFRVALIVIGNAALTQFMLSRRGPWQSIGGAFAATVVLNSLLLGLFQVLFTTDGEDTPVRTAFLLLVLSLILTLFDHFRPPWRRRERAEALAAGG